MHAIWILAALLDNIPKNCHVPVIYVDVDVEVVQESTLDSKIQTDIVILAFVKKLDTYLMKDIK